MVQTGIPVLSDHATKRRKQWGFTITDVAEALVYGTGVLQPGRHAHLLVGPKATLVIDPVAYVIVTMYETKYKHAQLAADAKMRARETKEIQCS